MNVLIDSLRSIVRPGNREGTLKGKTDASGIDGEEENGYTGGKGGEKMTYLRKYLSPFGEILLAADEKGLSGLWFVGAKYFGKGLPKDCKEGTTEALEETVHWLDEYFEGKEPKFTPPLHPDGTAFQEAVWRLLLRIPYGETVTYGELAKQLAGEMGLAHMSAQAVGGAVGRNPISLIVPCHRVMGADGSLVGYAGGIEKKEALLRLEQGF